MAKISLKKDYMDGNVLYGKDLNPNFETIETTINANDEAQSETNASVNEALTQLSSDVSQAKTDISTLQGDVADLETAVLDIPTKTSELENDSGFITNEDIPTKISELENDDNTVKDADYVHTDNNYTDEDKTKLTNMTEYKLPVATSSTLGGVMVGPGLNIGSNGSISLGIASATRLGGVKAGDGVQITADGSLNVIGGSTGDGIPTITGTQEDPIPLYNFTVGDRKVPIGLAYISGYTKEISTSEANDNYNRNLLYTSSNGFQFIGPYYERYDNGSLNLVFWFRPRTVDNTPGFFTEPFVKYSANEIITNTEQGYVTPKAVYDYVGALASLNTTDKSSIVNAINELVNSAGTPGEDGATFMPDVSEEGVISWTNDKGLPNPDPVNIKGPQGDTGAPGASGTNGVDGLDYLGYSGDVTYTSTTPSVGQTFTTLLSNYTRTPVVDDVHYLYLQQGQTTYLATCKVTNVSGNNVTVSILAFMNIKGATGPAGQDGADGVTPTIGENGNWYLGETDTGKPSRGEQGLKGDTGDQGPQGLPGPTGPGVPAGGTTGQVLTKNSDTDFDTIWKTVESGGIPKIYYLKASSSSPINLFDEEYCKYGIYICDSEDTSTSAYSNSLSQVVNFPGFYPFIRILLPYNQNDTETNRFYIRAIELQSEQLAVGAFTVTNPSYDEKESYSLKLKQAFHQMGGIASSNLTNKLAKAIDGKGSGLNIALSDLQTTDKTSLIAAINELNTRLAALENPTE